MTKRIFPSFNFQTVPPTVLRIHAGYAAGSHALYLSESSPPRRGPRPRWGPLAFGVLVVSKDRWTSDSSRWAVSLSRGTLLAGCSHIPPLIGDAHAPPLIGDRGKRVLGELPHRGDSGSEVGEMLSTEPRFSSAAMRSPYGELSPSGVLIGEKAAWYISFCVMRSRSGGGRSLFISATRRPSPLDEGSTSRLRTRRRWSVRETGRTGVHTSSFEAVRLHLSL